MFVMSHPYAQLGHVYNRIQNFPSMPAYIQGSCEGIRIQSDIRIEKVPCPAGTHPASSTTVSSYSTPSRYKRASVDKLVALPHTSVLSDYSSLSVEKKEEIKDVLAVLATMDANKEKEKSHSALTGSPSGIPGAKIIQKQISTATISEYDSHTSITETSEFIIPGTLPTTVQQPTQSASFSVSPKSPNSSRTPVATKESISFSSVKEISIQPPSMASPPRARTSSSASPQIVTKESVSVTKTTEEIPPRPAATNRRLTQPHLYQGHAPWLQTLYSPHGTPVKRGQPANVRPSRDGMRSPARPSQTTPPRAAQEAVQPQRSTRTPSVQKTTTRVSEYTSPGKKVVTEERVSVTTMEESEGSIEQTPYVPPRYASPGANQQKSVRGGAVLNTRNVQEFYKAAYVSPYPHVRPVVAVTSPRYPAFRSYDTFDRDSGYMQSSVSSYSEADSGVFYSSGSASPQDSFYGISGMGRLVSTERVPQQGSSASGQWMNDTSHDTERCNCCPCNDSY